MLTTSHQKLIEEFRIAAGEDGASDVGSLLEQFRSFLFATAQAALSRELSVRASASDIVQETMVQGLRGFEGFRGTNSEQLASWLREILKNRLRIERRRYARERRKLEQEEALSHSPDASDPSPSSTAIKAEDLRQVALAVRQLSVDGRVAIELRHCEQLSFVEIGQRLNRSEEAARKLYNRTLVQLQRMLPHDE